MAIRIWTDGAADGNFGTAGNWTGAAAPATGDTIIVDASTRTITSGMDQTAITSGTFLVGPKFYGSIGTSASPLKFGGTMSKITVNAPKAVTINLWPAAATDFVVNACPVGSYGCHLYDGNVTRLSIISAGGMMIGALSNPTTIVLGTRDLPNQPLNAIIESGATISTITQLYGNVDNRAAFTTLNGLGGTFNHNGTSTGDITTMNLYSDMFNVNWEAYNGNTGFTVGTVNAFGGLLDATQTAWNSTVTTMNYYGGRVALPQTWAVTTMNVFAGGVNRYSGPTPGTINNYVVAGGK